MGYGEEEEEEEWWEWRMKRASSGGFWTFETRGNANKEWGGESIDP